MKNVFEGFLLSLVPVVFFLLFLEGMDNQISRHWEDWTRREPTQSEKEKARIPSPMSLGQLLANDQRYLWNAVGSHAKNIPLTHAMVDCLEHGEPLTAEDFRNLDRLGGR